jgi:hypothetical protein
MKRAFIIIGIVAALIGITIILPALANYGRPGAMAIDAAGGSLAIVGFCKRFA